MAYAEKECFKYTPSDWTNCLHMESAASARTQANSQQLRQESRSLWLAADTLTNWDEYRNTSKLAKRVVEIRSWKEQLEKMHEKINQEIDKCQMAKDILDTRIGKLDERLSKVTNSLSTREQRRDVDYVSDRAENELKRFQKAIIDARDKLQNVSSHLFGQLIKLKEARHAVVADLQDKTIAMDIDLEQYHLKKDDPCVSFKPNCMRIPKGSIVPEQWMAFSQSNWDRAAREISKSSQLRLVAHDTLCIAENDLNTQKEKTKLALRNRAHEMQLALDELNYQQKNLEDEICHMENDLDKLEQSIMGKIPMTKLVQTRLERRTYRPGMDLVYDAPQRGLMKENCQLEATTAALKQKQSELRHGLHQLQLQLNRVKDDIKIKTESLLLDEHCLEVMDDQLPEAARITTMDFETNDRLMKSSFEDKVSKVTSTGKDFDHMVG